MSQLDDPPTFPGYTRMPPGSWDGTTEALAMGVEMEPPEGFLARAVARGLAVVEAEEALVAYRAQRAPANDRPAAPELAYDDDEPETLRPMPIGSAQEPRPARATPRGRHDSGVFLTPPLAADDTPVE